MRKLLVLSGIVIALTAATSTAQASTVSATSTVTGLRHSIIWHRSRTWYWQSQAGVTHTYTNYAERKTRSILYLRWLNNLWNDRQKAAYRYALTHPAIAHESLWLCIHNYEGSWNNADTGHNGHYGGLQMTSPWGRGEYYVYRADYLTPTEQMRKAELGYRASGYSLSWLLGQWYHPDCVAQFG